MSSFRHLRRLLPPSSCTRSASHVSQAVQSSSPQLIPAPKPREVLLVQTLGDIQGMGEHYQRSYRQFTSWLNSGGHAELFEGCVVVGKVVNVVNRVSTFTLFYNLRIKYFCGLQYSVLITNTDPT